MSSVIRRFAKDLANKAHAQDERTPTDVVLAREAGKTALLERARSVQSKRMKEKNSGKDCRNH